MKRNSLILGVLAAAALPGPAAAGPYSDAAGRCAIAATTPEDRAALTRWIFVAAANNPALSDIVTISAEAREQIFRAAGALVNRIMLQACRREVIAAVRNEGAAGIQATFQALGQMAGIELMMAPEAQVALQGLDRYLDSEGLEALGREAEVRPAI